MSGITRIEGIAAPLMRMNVDTDAIIPSREMKQVSKDGLADGLFAGWRYLDADSREPDPRFILNRSPFTDASVLVAGRNFGCGSSREHAVWALKEWGIQAIIAPSFGSIFASNCLRNGVLPVVLQPDTVERIASAVSKAPLENTITIDLERMYVVMGREQWTFTLPQREREMLLRGLSAIELTLEREDAIRDFELRDETRRPWAHAQSEWVVRQ